MGLKSYLPQTTEQKGLKSYLPATQKATTTPREVLGQYGYEAPKQSGWSLLGKGFMNTLGGVLEVLRTGEYAVGGLLAGKGPITGIKEKISPSTTLLGEKKEEDKLWSQRGIAALAIDILLDPTTYLTFGAGGATKLSTKGGQVLLNKSGQKLMKTMVGKGVSEAAARRTMARVIQEGGEAAATKYIGKSGLKFMGKVFIPAEQFQKAGKVLGKLPGAGTVNKVGSGFSKAFVPFREIDKMPVKIGGKGTYTDFLYKPYVRETRDKIFKEIDTVKVAAAKAYKEYGIDIGKEIGQRVEKGTKAVSKLDPLAEQASKFKSADEFINSQTLFRGQKPEFKELQKVAQSNAVDNLLIGRGVFTTTNESIAKTYGSNVFKFQKPAGKIFDLTNASEKELRKFLPESFFKERRLGGLIHRPDDTFTSSYKTYKELIKEGLISNEILKEQEF